MSDGRPSRSLVWWGRRGSWHEVVEGELIAGSCGLAADPARRPFGEHLGRHRPQGTPSIDDDSDARIGKPGRRRRPRRHLRLLTSMCSWPLRPFDWPQPVCGSFNDPRISVQLTRLPLRDRHRRPLRHPRLRRPRRRRPPPRRSSTLRGRAWARRTGWAYQGTTTPAPPSAHAEAVGEQRAFGRP
jgi:hypothetical protein